MRLVSQPASESYALQQPIVYLVGVRFYADRDPYYDTIQYLWTWTARSAWRDPDSGQYRLERFARENVHRRRPIDLVRCIDAGWLVRIAAGGRTVPVGVYSRSPPCVRAYRNGTWTDEILDVLPLL